MEPLIIRKVSIEPISIVLDGPFTIAIGKKHSIENVLMTLELDNGENQSTVLATLKSVQEFLLGKDVSDYNMISIHLKSVFWAQATARCAVNLAAGLGGFDFIDLDPHLMPDQEPFSGGQEFSDPFYKISDKLEGIGVSRK